MLDKYIKLEKGVFMAIFGDNYSFMLNFVKFLTEKWDFLIISVINHSLTVRGDFRNWSLAIIIWSDSLTMIEFKTIYLHYYCLCYTLLFFHVPHKKK